MKMQKLSLVVGLALASWSIQSHAQNADKGPPTNGAAQTESAKPRRVFTVPEIAKNPPEGEVTVRFRVGTVSQVRAAQREGDPPFSTTVLRAELKADDDAQFGAVLPPKVVAQLLQTGVRGTEAVRGDRFRGKLVEVTGTLRRSKSQIAGTDRITDFFTIEVGELKDLKVVE